MNSQNVMQSLSSTQIIHPQIVCDTNSVVIKEMLTMFCYFVILFFIFFACLGTVSLAGVQSGLWSVKGGNKLVPQRLATKAKISIQEAKVKEVTLRSKGEEVTYHIEAHSADGNDIYEEDYDVVIVAVPLQNSISNIKFKNFPKDLGPFSETYHRTVATFVKAWPNITYFDIGSVSDFPTALLTSNPDLYYNSIGYRIPVDFDSSIKKLDYRHSAPVYKVFSRERLTQEQIDELFQTQEEVEVVDWTEAYPTYSSDQRHLPTFELHQHLYYVNGIEMASSCIEMDIIGARNVALLTYNRWMGLAHKIDSNAFSNSKENTKTEL